MSLTLIIISAIIFGIFLGIFVPILTIYILNILTIRKINKEREKWEKKFKEEKDKYQEVKNAREERYKQERTRRKEYGRTAGRSNPTTEEHAEQGRDKSHDARQGGVSLPDSDYTLRD